MDWLVTVPPRVASLVSTAGISPVTVMVWVCSPGCTTRSTRMVWPNFQEHVAVLHVAEAFGFGPNGIRAGVQGGATYWPGAVCG